MFKKLFGGFLLCGIIVPVSIALSVIDGVSLVLIYMGKGIKLIVSPLYREVIKMVAEKPDNILLELHIKREESKVL